MSVVLGFFSLLALMFGGEDALQEKYENYESNQPPNSVYKSTSSLTHNQPTRMVIIEDNGGVPLSADEVLLERTLKYKEGEGMRPTELPKGYEELSKELLMQCLPTRTCSGG